jgi:hypothetical protein
MAEYSPKLLHVTMATVIPVLLLLSLPLLEDRSPKSQSTSPATFDPNSKRPDETWSQWADRQAPLHIGETFDQLEREKQLKKLADFEEVCRSAVKKLEQREYPPDERKRIERDMQQLLLGIQEERRRIESGQLSSWKVLAE